MKLAKASFDESCWLRWYNQQENKINQTSNKTQIKSACKFISYNFTESKRYYYFSVEKYFIIY